MKRLLFDIIFPLTLILFGTVTKWWRVALVDAPDDILIGFPLPYVCSGWHTSLSLQIFILELCIDLATYVASTATIVFIIHRFVTAINVPKPFVIVLYATATLFLFFFAVIGANPDNIFYWRNPFDFKVLETGIRFNLQKM